MFETIKRIHNSSQRDKIAVLFTFMNTVRIFSVIMCLQDPTFRLPRDVVPIHYVLQLHPDFSTALFSGEVTITIYTFNETQLIAVHAKYLSIESATLSEVTMGDTTTVLTGDVMLKNIIMVDEYDMLVIETTAPMAIGYYNLRFEFNGTMKKRYKGFFMMSFSDPISKEIRKIATSRFEPIYARYAFPCFDEPQLKAMFDIRLVQPDIENYNSLSNMPTQHFQRGSPLPGSTTVYFQRTPPISTYQIALTVTDLVNETAFVATRWDKYGLILLRAWTISEKSIGADLVLHVTYRALDLFMHLFRLNYPLPKFDVIAIPGFSKDTVVNWGLALYNEPSMLYYPRLNSIDDLKIATNRITYGLTHMWFGCLVTMNWWNDVWLTKSFATYMQYYTTDRVFPDWKDIESFVVEAKFPSMRRDALVSSLPIVQPTVPFEISEFADSTFHNKGASIIRMLYHMLGEKHFFLGVANFLQEYRFNTAAMKDVILSMQTHYHGREDLNRFFETWTKQSGFPVLNIERIGNVYYINQSRFFCNNNTLYDELDSPYLHKWDVPIFYVTNISNGTKRMFLPYDTTRIKLLVNDQITWVKFNTNSVGFFSTNYDIQTWNVFLEVLRNNPQELRDLDRTDLINDAFLNAEAGRIPYTIPMTMIEYMRSWPSYMLWQLLFDKLMNIHTKLRNTEILTAYEVFIRNLINQTYSSVGWDIDHLNPYERRRLRTVVLKMACAVRLENCINEVGQKFRYWISNPHIRPHPDIREIVYYYGMLNAGEKKDWDIVYDLFVNEPDYEERRRLMTCLTAIRDSTILINMKLKFRRDTSNQPKVPKMIASTRDGTFFYTLDIQDINENNVFLGQIINFSDLSSKAFGADGLLQQRYFEIAKDSEVMSNEEYLTTFSVAVSNPLDPAIVWNFYKTNWNFLKSRYSDNNDEFVRLIVSVTLNIQDTYLYYEIERFFKEHPCDKLSADARNEALEVIRNNIFWMKQNYPQMKYWLNNIYK